MVKIAKDYIFEGASGKASLADLFAGRRQLKAFKERMEWTVPFFSSHGSDFNDDFHVSLGAGIEGEASGVSVFLRDGQSLFHTYSTHDRGTDILNGTLNYLDLTPLGRQEDWEEPRGRANSSASGWWELHDEY